uniref:Odorant receptor n=1 Tax=Vespula pensylvanica TaxID=30213 RepID=A0A834P946_VESPE|nr:hypothetical protein H0235_005355 [Vespula pensylvanica]
MLTKVWQVEYACGWNLYTMKFIGIWPEERSFDRISSYKVLIGIAFIILFCTLPQSIMLCLDRDDFDMVMENLSVDNMNGTIAFIKMICFWSSGGQMKDLLSAMEKDWKEIPTKEDEKKMMKQAKFSRILATRATFICYALIAVYAVKRCLSMRTDGRLLFLSSYFPYETMTSPIFELTFICQVIGSVYYTTAYTTVDTFLAMLILHVCEQLSRLQNELIDLNSKIKDLLTAMEKDWEEVIRMEDKDKMMKYAKYSRILSTKVNAFCYSLIAIYATTRCLSMRTEGRLYFFPSYFPFETMTSPLFEFKFVGQTIGAIYYSVTYTAVDTFLAMLILHVCGQLSRLRNDLIHLNTDTRKNFQMQLNYIVERHNHLNR